MSEFELLLDTFDRLDIHHISYTPGPEPLTEEELCRAIRNSIEAVERGEGQEIDLTI